VISELYFKQERTGREKGTTVDDEEEEEEDNDGGAAEEVEAEDSGTIEGGMEFGVINVSSI